MAEYKPDGLTVTVRLVDLDLFQSLIDLLRDTVECEDIPVEVRGRISDRLNAIVEASAT
jgi:hypothetical protein